MIFLHAFLGRLAKQYMFDLCQCICFIGLDIQDHHSKDYSNAKQKFTKSISIPGVSHIIHSRSSAARVFWSTICFCALGIIFWQVSILVKHYYSYPKKVRRHTVQCPQILVGQLSICVCLVLLCQFCHF